MEYQTKRGGRVVFQDIAKPTTMEWGTPLEAMEAALELEKTVNQSLLDLHKVAGDKGDGHLSDFLESEYLGEQVEGIKAIGDLNQDEESRRRTRPAFDRQGDGILNFSNHQNPNWQQLFSLIGFEINFLLFGKKK